MIHVEDRKTGVCVKIKHMAELPEEVSAWVSPDEQYILTELAKSGYGSPRSKQLAGLLDINIY